MIVLNIVFNAIYLKEKQIKINQMVSVSKIWNHFKFPIYSMEIHMVSLAPL